VYQSLPIVEREVLVSGAREGFGIVEIQEGRSVEEPTEFTSSTFEGEVVTAAEFDLGGIAHLAVGAVFVHACDDVEPVVPTAEDHHVARGRVARRASKGFAITVHLALDVSRGGVRPGIELDSGIAWEFAPEPERVVVGVLHAEGAIFDGPSRAGGAPVGADLVSLETVFEALPGRDPPWRVTAQMEPGKGGDKHPARDRQGQEGGSHGGEAIAARLEFRHLPSSVSSRRQGDRAVYEVPARCPLRRGASTHPTAQKPASTKIPSSGRPRLTLLVCPVSLVCSNP